MYGHVITKFSGMGRFTELWGSAHAHGERVELQNNQVQDLDIRS